MLTLADKVGKGGLQMLTSAEEWGGGACKC